MLRELRRRVVRYTRRWTRWFYYQALYGRALPRSLAAALAGWDQSRLIREKPRSARTWDDQYERGHWAGFESPLERARYSVIVGLLSATAMPSVLDVGCGNGLLYKRFRPYGSTRFVGIDLSQVAIDAARAAAGPDATFLAADATAYQPEPPFDAIVFNEMLYFLNDPVAEVERYAGALAPGDRIVVSSYLGSPRAAAILRLLRRALDVQEETLVKHDRIRWMVTVLTPCARAAAAAR